jgi:hypothetical protein
LPREVQIDQRNCGIHAQDGPLSHSMGMSIMWVLLHWRRLEGKRLVSLVAPMSVSKCGMCVKQRLSMSSPQATTKCALSWNTTASTLMATTFCAHPPSSDWPQEAVRGPLHFKRRWDLGYNSITSYTFSKELTFIELSEDEN